jgi:hypothetical protein
MLHFTVTSGCQSGQSSPRCLSALCVTESSFSSRPDQTREPQEPPSPSPSISTSSRTPSTADSKKVGDSKSPRQVLCNQCLHTLDVSGGNKGLITSAESKPTERQPVTPLKATLTGHLASVASKRLTQYLSPSDATLTKKRGGRFPDLSQTFHHTLISPLKPMPREAHPYLCRRKKGPAAREPRYSPCAAF